MIAEGVQSLEHGQLLLSLGCEVAQGYFIARPMPASEVPGWVADFVAPSQWQALDEAI
ncbi:Oxygen sensor protein DosP [compost metagenome]